MSSAGRLRATVTRLRAGFAALAVVLLALLALSLDGLSRSATARGAWAIAALACALALAFALWRLVRRLTASHPGLDDSSMERQRMQRRLVESRRRLQLLLDHMPDGVVAFDGEGRVQWINPAARLIFQCSAEGTVGRPVRELIPALDVEALEAQEPPPEGQAAAVPRVALHGLRPDGTTVPLEAAIVRLAAEGPRVGMCVVRDTSASQRVEHMKHEFVSMVSHELRTPLTSLRGSLALLADGSIEGLPADAQRLLRLAADNSERLVHLVNDILDFEKLRAGAMRVELDLADLQALAARAAEAIEGMAHQAGVVLRIQSGPRALPVQADPARLMQVLGNLLSNAIKYSPRGGTVTLALQRHGERARLEVRDQGPGVPPEFAARLFEPFAQAGDPRHRKQGGTGLGLAISRALMEMMDGAIGLAPPQAGQGAVFWIELPLGDARPSTFGSLE
ncbi:MAG TPA: ATP-binding protein [Burkholderiaceae bacterium]|nr:ATP-binding protein [Burkholderiaceae bacterium]